jgi:hypothetical protein
VVQATLPELTYKLAASGQLTPAELYVIVVGAPKAPAAVPVTMLFDVGNMSPLSRAILNVKVKSYTLDDLNSVTFTSINQEQTDIYYGEKFTIDVNYNKPNGFIGDFEIFCKNPVSNESNLYKM